MSKLTIRNFLVIGLGLVTAIIGLMLVISMTLNQPTLQVKYTAPDLSSTSLSPSTGSGFYQVQSDSNGTQYVWTQGHSSFLINLRTSKPLEVSFEVRSAAVAGGSAAALRLMVNNQLVSSFQPDPKELNFQTFHVKFNPPPPENKEGKVELKIELVANTFRAGMNDNRLLGTMVKSFTLDKTEAWSGVANKIWLLWFLPIIAFLSIIFNWLAKRFKLKILEFLGLFGCLFGIIINLIVFVFFLRTGVLDPDGYLLWIAGFIYFALLFAITGISNPFILALTGKGLHKVQKWVKLQRYILGMYSQRQTNKLKTQGRFVIKWQRFTWLWVLMLYMVVALGVMAPIASSTHDLPDQVDLINHVSSIVETRMGLEEGQFPVMVGPWQQNGLRYANNQFYGQLPYNLGALIYKYITPDNPYIAYLLLVWAAFWIGGFFTYKTCLWLTRSHPAAILAGIIYILVPYTLLEVITQGFFTEALGRAFLCMAFYLTIRSYTRPKLILMLFNAIAWFALATTHITTFVYGSIFVGFIIACLALPRLTKTKTWIRLLRVGIGYALSWLLAMYFLGPLVLLQQQLWQTRNFNVYPFQYSWLTSLPALLSPTSVPPGPEPGRPHQENLNLALGWPILAAWAIVAYYYISERRPLKWNFSLRLTHRFIGPLLVLFVITFFLTWTPFDFWKFVPSVFYVIQWAWRFMGFVAWLGALLSAYGLVLLFGKKMDGRHLCVGIILLAVASSSYLPAQQTSSRSLETIIKEPQLKIADVGYLYYLAPNEVPLQGNGGVYDFRVRDGASNAKLSLDKQNQYKVFWLPGEKPILHMEGEIPVIKPSSDPLSRLKILNDGPLTITALSNNEQLTNKTLTGGAFSWDIPLEKAPVENNFFDLGFKINDSSVPVTLKSLTVKGLFAEETVLPLEMTQSNFRQQGTVRIGVVNVPTWSRYVQLPVLFYPNMLEVRVDGRPVSYFPSQIPLNSKSIGEKLTALVGVALDAGVHNVSIRYTGVIWANLISLVSWFLVLAMFLGLLTFNIIKNIWSRKWKRVLKQAQPIIPGRF